MFSGARPPSPWALALAALAGACAPLPPATAGEECVGKCDALADVREGAVTRDVRRVLLIPLYKEYMYSTEALYASWRGHLPAFRRGVDELAEFYRARGQERGQEVDVRILDDIYYWETPETPAQMAEAIAFTRDQGITVWQKDAENRLVERVTPPGAASPPSVEALQRRRSFWGALEEVRGEVFDRVVLVGHGGFDGPLTTNGAVDHTYRPGSLVKRERAQPGVIRRFEVSFDPERWTDLHALLEEHHEQLVLPRIPLWEVLMTKLEFLVDDMSHVAACIDDRMENAEVSCRQECMTTCAPDGATAGGSAVVSSTYVVEECETGCFHECADRGFAESQSYCEREAIGPFFRFGEYYDEAEFLRFAQAIRDVVAPDGMLFLGHCNAATPAYTAGELGSTKGTVPFASGTLGYGYATYADALAAASQRHIAAPVGNTDAEDVIERVKLLEDGAEQHYLRLVDPLAPRAGAPKPEPMGLGTDPSAADDDR